MTKKTDASMTLLKSLARGDRYRECADNNLSPDPKFLDGNREPTTAPTLFGGMESVKKAFLIDMYTGGRNVYDPAVLRQFSSQYSIPYWCFGLHMSTRHFAQIPAGLPYSFLRNIYAATAMAQFLQDNQINPYIHHQLIVLGNLMVWEDTYPEQMAGTVRALKSHILSLQPDSVDPLTAKLQSFLKPLFHPEDFKDFCAAVMWLFNAPCQHFNDSLVPQLDGAWNRSCNIFDKKQYLGL